MAHRHLVIVLGSSRFPNCSLEPAISLRTSARRFIEYCGEALDLQIDDDILDLFGSKETSGRQLQIISDFLKENIGPETGNPNVLVTLYYLGHGYFAKTDRSYCLAVCGTTDSFTPSDGLQAKDLLFRLKNFAPNRKRFIVLDACFSASAMGDYTTLSATDNAIKDELERNLDDWTAMYCAARSDEYALAPAKSRFTLFSHGVLEALEKGGPHPADVTNTPPLLLSLTKLDEIAWSIIRTEFQELGDIPRPLLFFPEKPKFNNEEEIFPIASQLRGQRLSAETRGVLQQEMQLIKASIQEEIINLIGQEIESLSGKLENKFMERFEDRMLIERILPKVEMTKRILQLHKGLQSRQSHIKVRRITVTYTCNGLKERNPDRSDNIQYVTEIASVSEPVFTFGVRATVDGEFHGTDLTTWVVDDRNARVETTGIPVPPRELS